MKSLKELNKIKEEVKEKQEKIKENDIKITIAMGTCGIAAGAREVSEAILDELETRDLDNVTVAYTGCIGLCHHEPLVKVAAPDQPVVLYGNLNPEAGRKIIAQHIVNNRIVDKLAINKE
ncbi:(2Fe-2S) ferredoxin domain-containing protein [Selenihalanaerobacter shriftii]|uniref:NAD(P)-dependent iron-only hydrogenase iron-sulfur protein n=1 Tax=Selenihalanaerobacter shriftii TaxID=142842 RepID=A0A1T4NQX8_9FIRM|nr:(2Fe-2S) ferredoxin domain-containing protein [Selenihalanaerobacter shriftii]SJZ81604.1 NAD(P)-dependent iron-only hydrogenase iron-sulfur protein [Selenihalanaerobacter shriftii]